MGQTIDTAMPADAKALVDTRADIAPLLGTWVNAMGDTEHITRAVVTARDGAVFVRLHAPFDWGEVEAVPYTVPGTTDVAGFHARYDLDGTRTELAGNVKFGILVIQSYTSFQDGRLSHYAREFFYQPTTEPADERTGGVSLTGDWVNSYPATKWIKEFTVTGSTLHVRGGGEPADWGETTLTTYVDNLNEPAFHAEYDLAPFTAVLAANSNKNIIIIAAFFRFKDGRSDNYLCREFFVPR
jgi:hypothetical protein